MKTEKEIRTELKRVKKIVEKIENDDDIPSDELNIWKGWQEALEFVLTN